MKLQSRNALRTLLTLLAEREKKDLIILGFLKKITANARKIIAYVPDKWEVKIDPKTLDWTEKEIYFPKITDRELEFVLPEVWENGPFGILEPNGTKILSPHEADWIIVPALGYDEFGYRLGRGGGFYDRTLCAVDPSKLIGLTYEELFPASFAKEDHDIRVGRVITEKKNYQIV
ncbi:MULTISPECIES: 5-formyltetrahydrofolate cyclo-ligase [Leptospira]|uniref:5-formyltetrahydrofolate cyclo-ligase n=4 Tax=Leptospira borgpetersenii TaxID=174 RepID=A0A0E3AZM3_LEPBO|nr:MULTISPECIES: 5-formyltetrahydrofolate cyclo-ligase [Leptospira]ALO26865.1 5-formyltetrahydrofolate cyclo-ligase [Leptospira borgpetersenii serovar Ballum]ANH01367.1 5-formyltetrahydrofolate cyclo-ligase [Leptospira borgpetersenii str. 4E]AXX16477.1 5-formyltetrahydrofolate cyclo-ligase [Leptospira borgpetersenii serovar Ceylonica]EKP13764.1 5-formyltetrahydrofolate cyclo-ligase [Leptospira borgpetersenii str. 200801926]EKQ90045.1 5-formyltetrahydrofolate cyclo-ligase [Leptospira borgpeters